MTHWNPLFISLVDNDDLEMLALENLQKRNIKKKVRLAHAGSVKREWKISSYEVDQAAWQALETMLVI